MCKWKTVCPDSAPVLITVLQLVKFFDLAILLPTESKCPNKLESSAVHSNKLIIGFLGITKKWTGAGAWISLKAIQNSSS